MTSPAPAASSRVASCSCGALSLTCEGEPVRVSVCHCLACQRRTGSAFGAQSRWSRERVSGLDAPARAYVRVADSGNQITFRFCGVCGATVWWEIPGLAEFVVVPVGAFADPSFPAPTVTVYEDRRHAWATVESAVERYD